MSRTFDEVRWNTLLFAGRFGFVTRDLFFEYLCPLGRSQRFSFWRKLIGDGWLIPHEPQGRTAYLSKKARTKFGMIPARSKYFIEHDEVAARLLLECERLGVVERFWSERELVALQVDSLSVLGSRTLEKIPDLIMDLSGSYGRLRVAVEVERAVKAKERYQAAALSYLEMKNVDLILYVCRIERTAELIKNAFEAHGAEKAPGLFITADFIKCRFSCEVSYRGRRLQLIKFLSLALKRDLKLSDKKRTAVRKVSEVGGSAA